MPPSREHLIKALKVLPILASVLPLSQLAPVFICLRMNGCKIWVQHTFKEVERLAVGNTPSPCVLGVSPPPKHKISKWQPLMCFWIRAIACQLMI